MTVLSRLYMRVENYLQGWPDHYLTIALLLVAGVFVLIALRGKPVTKAVALAYAVFP